jgi:hypothetical protein
MKRIVNSRIVLAGIFAVAGLPNLHAQRGCSNVTLNGAYGFYSSGTVLPNRTPRVTVGREVYDGNGHFSNTFTVNDDGAVSHNNGSGTYNVNPDCTGTIFTTLGMLQLRLDFVIADGGNEIHFLVGSNPPILDVYGVRKKQFPNFERVCSNADLKGTYGFYSTGSVVPAGTPRLTVGRETYDGAGHFSDLFTVNDNGAETQHINSGLYTVNRDCTGTIVTPLGLLILTIDFVIVDSGREIYFMVSSNPAGVAVYGVRTKFSADQE